jgi:hypothetical protein
LVAELESRVEQLKRLILLNDGENVADAAFAFEVDALIESIYDDIGTIKVLPLRSLFDIFLIKVLYVGRRSRDAGVLDYLGEMLYRFLWSRELSQLGNQPDLLLSILAETKEAHRFQNLFEASRQLGDNSLFVTGMFPDVRPRRRWGGRRRRGPSQFRFDRAYYVELGRRYYRVAAAEPLAEFVGQREVLRKLADYFTQYQEALSEVSQRYVLGFDMDLMANKMLDAFNAYRRSGDPVHLDSARRYAALLKVDGRSFPGLFRRRPPPVLGAGL